jgi:hypothetical protein
MITWTSPPPRALPRSPRSGPVTRAWPSARPGDGYGHWIARRDGMILAADRDPGALLAVLEELLGP